MNRLVDKKSWYSVFLLTVINNLALFFRFRKIEISGRANLPAGAFLVIANHSSRWDSLIMQRLLSRRAARSANSGHRLFSRPRLS
jgi:1-acyl-sn-glycerol-3-phosphate acyltransferase